MSIVEQYLLQLNTEKHRWRRAVAVLTALSLIVALVTVWNLRLTGITIANSASCGFEEHQHAYACQRDGYLVCERQEHIHDISCYSNPKANTETSLDWRQMFADFPYTGNLREDLVGVAKTQVGYNESQLNFEVNESGERKGYTRYGAWYGAPYNDWSAMFVSFCLHFAGADAEEYPNSSGGSAMAGLWNAQGKFLPAGEYIPQVGDLVFFDNNTVGIVADVYNASMCVIHGDALDQVSADMMFIEDTSITGWGITGDVQTETEIETESTPSDDDVLDITNGPAIYIFEGSAPTLPKMQKYSLRNPRTVTDLLPYLEANGGTYFFTLLDRNNRELPKDDQGNYIAQANTDYKITISISSPEGFAPGTYQYQIPNGLMVDGGEGDFILQDGTNVGSWTVTDTGLITLVFNENMNSRSDITISATLGINFPEQEDPIDFDGFITVKVEPPVQQTSPTVLTKWGTPDGAGGKINWKVRIDGHADSQIPGNIITDRPTLSDWSRPHSYTQSDIDNGLTFGVSDPSGGWHAWHVSPDDPHLLWDEEGWSYKIPKTVTCDYCGELELGNDGWIYYIDYSSTPTKLDTPGTFDYENKVTVDGQTAWGWSNFTHVAIAADIVKSGSFVSDASGGGFVWEFQATIPGRVEGQRAEYSWFVMDEMRLWDANGTYVDHVQNDVNLSEVIAVRGGEVIRVPRIQDATDSDMFAWDNSWTAIDNGISHTRTLNLLCRCQCTPETCHWTGCGDYWFQRDDGSWAANGFCQCWTETQTMTFTFVYKTEDVSIIENYGALGYQVNNIAQLYYMPDSETSIRVSYDDASVAIPNMFEKQLTQDFDGYTAHYKITVNEAKVALTNGTPLTIHDVMTDTLAYISGSLVISVEDSLGNTGVLQLGAEYTVTYDGSGSQTDASGKKVHVLDIVILNPQPVTYILDYDTMLIMPEHITGGVKYSNSATITLWGQDVTNGAVEKVYADFNIAAKSYAVMISKTCSLTGKALPGATFGLYNEQGGLITTGITDQNGNLTFQTNITQGIVLREHVLYYLQEMFAPLAYQKDDTLYWFCFCDKTGDSCDTCNSIISETDAIRIPFEQKGIVDIVNHPSYVELPTTGGSGNYIYILSGLVLTLGPLVYGFSLRRRHRRRFKN